MIKMNMICGNCKAECRSVHTVGWSNHAVCEKCQLGSMYKFIKFVQNNHLPFWLRKVIATTTVLIPFFWGFNKCSHCGLTPPFGRHTVDCDGWGTSLLCIACFKELPIEIKLDYYRQHLLKYDKIEDRWNELREAVIRDHRLIPFRNSLNTTRS